ncbi:MAG: SDR family NAD(P)-dependent oxidoreductase, partial [Gemella haemolysans]|nr:SDR family NAD(P)-dependent oxidoreductase [Gemella haemolysans]
METGKQKILITGASSGLGRELAHQFAQKGSVELILVARRKEALEKVAKKCSSFE